MSRIRSLLVFSVVLVVGSAVAVTSTAQPAAAVGFGVPTSVTSTANPSHLGQSITFRATVVAPLAFGNVVFFDGVSPLNAVALLTPNTGGICDCIPDGTSSATFTTSSLSSGTHLITAAAVGTPFGTSLSDPIIQTVQGSETTTVVSAAPSSTTVFGQGITFTATVTANVSSAGTPTGSVQITDNGVDVGGSVTLGSGSASVDSPNLPVGVHSIVATYTSDDPTFLGSSGTASQQVDMASTLTSLTSNVNPSVFGQPVLLSATVGAVAPGAGSPTGTVTFTDGASNLGTAILAGDHASISTPGLSVGSHNLSATYGGDASFRSSGGTLSQVVNRAPTATVVTSSADPSVFGQKVSFTAIVCPASPSTAAPQAPTGTVTFTADGGPLPFDAETLVPASGQPGCQSATSVLVGTFSVATHPLSVSYQGDSNFVVSTALLPGGQVVNKAPTATALTTAPNPSFFGDAVMLNAAVTVPPPGAGTPTGNVTFADGATVLGTDAIDPAGHATFITAGLQVGTHALSATYSGDGNFLPSASTSQSQTVRCMTIVTGKVNGGLKVSGSTCVNDATINGGITVLPGAALSLNRTTVHGGLGSSAAKAVTVCASTIDGASSISMTSGFVLLGDGGYDGFSCGGNTLHGALALNGNAGQLELGGNNISGGATITATSGVGPTLENATTRIEGNHISGHLSCAGNAPDPVSDGHPNTSTGGATGQCGSPTF